MLKLCALVLSLVVSFECSYTSVNRDRVVQYTTPAGPSGGDGLERSFSGSDLKIGDGVSDRGSKDMLLSLLTGLAVKLMTLLPLVLTTMALLVGFTLATSKAALVLGGGLALYYYLSEIKFLVPLAKDVHEYSPSFLQQSVPQHELEGFTRDRNMLVKTSTDT